MVSARSDELLALARRSADAFPPEVVEVVFTGSVSRGLADKLSDDEHLDGWGAQGLPSKRVSGSLEGGPCELVFWPRAFAEEEFEAVVGGKLSSSADGGAPNSDPSRRAAVPARVDARRGAATIR